MKSKAEVINPEGLIRHNIEIWRNSGYLDWHIGTVLIRPRLKTPEDFRYWGLQWNPPDGSALSPPEPKHRANKRESLARLHDALDRGIAGNVYVSRERLCRMAQVGNGTFQILCVEYPEVHRKWSQLKRLNSDRTTADRRRFVQIGQARRGKLDQAAAIVDRAIAEGVPVTMQQVSRDVEQYRTWLQQLCRDRCHPALALRDRMDEHNDSLRRQQQQSA